MLASTYSPPKRSTIGDEKLNFRVRNENGWTLLAKTPTHNLQLFNFQNSFFENGFALQALFRLYDISRKLEIPTTSCGMGPFPFLTLLAKTPTHNTQNIKFSNLFPPKKGGRGGWI